MNITYTRNGDYLIPNIVIRKTKPIGHYGRLRKAYLEMHRPILFNELVLSDKLFEHCAEIEEAARKRMELIVPKLAKQYGVTEQLKADNQMEWVRQMNACKAQAEEVVKAEFVEVPYAISNSSCNNNGVCYPWSYLFKRKRCFFDCRLQYRLKSRKTKN